MCKKSRFFDFQLIILLLWYGTRGEKGNHDPVKKMRLKNRNHNRKTKEAV